MLLSIAWYCLARFWSGLRHLLLMDIHGLMDYIVNTPLGPGETLHICVIPSSAAAQM
jgi:hypothetical protein